MLAEKNTLSIWIFSEHCFNSFGQLTFDRLT